MSTNISKQKREELLAKIKEIRTFIASAEQDENTGNLLAYLSELERDVGGKKYGLVFEEHREEIDEILATHTPVLTEDGSLLIDNGGQMNFLLEGDNLASLQLLLKTHKGKIDLIYIDPPYNTSNKDFVYDDTFVDTTDTFRHSKWISFIAPRLRIAKNLLSANGVIFISIDDNEQAALKLLCDDIFGESNYIACMPRLTKKQGKNQQNTFASNHDYLLCYALNLPNVEFVKKDAPSEDYPLQDEYYEERGGYKLNQALDYDTLGYVHSLDFPIEIDGKTYYAGSVSENEYIHRKETNPKDGFRWRWSKDLFDFGYANGFVVVKKSRNGERIYTKTYYKAKIEKKNGSYFIDYIDRTIAPTTLEYVDNAYSNDNAKKNFDALNMPVKFDYSKPVSLIRHIVSLCKNPSATVLDFFAGSGTTGQAVMKLNAEDGGTRRFILCTNNENNICREVTYERIRRVIDKEGYAASLKYFKVEYVPIDSRMYYEYADELLRHIRELVELENGVNFTANAEIGIVLTEEELEEFVGSDAFALCRKLYIGHDVLPTDEQMAAIKAGGIEISVIPDYYYKDLQEG